MDRKPFDVQGKERAWQGAEETRVSALEAWHEDSEGDGDGQEEQPKGGNK